MTTLCSNASGKSFFGKLLGQYVRKEHKIEVMNVGMAFRTESGVARCFVFGDESDSSTGMLSYKAVQGGIRTCRGRENDHVLFLDEPDIGLSEEFQGALGRVIAEFASDIPDKTKLFGVVTHSRRLIRHLLPIKPHHVRLGDEMKLADVVDFTPAEVKGLEEIALKRFRSICRICDGKKK